MDTLIYITGNIYNNFNFAHQFLISQELNFIP